MVTMIRKNFTHIGKGKFIALIVGCLLFAISGRVNTTLSYEQHTLSALTDHYYLIYFAIPVFLLICFSLMEDDSEIVIMRYGSYSRYFWTKWISLASISLVFMLIQLAAILASGIGLTSQNDWALSGSPAVSELFGVLGNTFASPGLCFALTALYMFFGLCMTALVCMWIGHFLTKSLSVKVLITLYVITMCGIKIPIVQKLPITFFSHLIILHHNLTGEYRFAITIITAVLMIALILWTVKKRPNVGRKGLTVTPKGLTAYYSKMLFTPRNGIVMAAAVCLLALLKYFQTGGAPDAHEWIKAFFAGHGIGTLRILNFLEMLISNGVPVYMLAVFIEKITSNHSDFITIRLKKRVKMLSGIINTAALFILLYGTCLALIPILIISVSGAGINGDTVSLTLLATGLKLLDIAAQFLLMAGIYCFTGHITAGFIAITGLNLLCVLPEKAARFIPFGLSSLARLNIPGVENGLSFPAAYAVLLAFGCLLFLWLRFLGYKKLLKN